MSLTMMAGANGPSMDNLTDYQKQVLAAMGYEQSTDFDTGNTSWIDRNANDGTPRVTDPSQVFERYLSGFNGSHGTAGYVDAGARLPNGYSNLDPSVQDAFRDTVDYNGKNYFRSDANFGGTTYNDLLNSKDYAPLMQKYGINANDFVDDPKYGKMIVNDPRTQRFAQEAHFKTQDQNWLSNFLTTMPVIMGSFGMGSLAGPALGASTGMGTTAAKTALGAIPSAIQGQPPGIGSLLGLLGNLGGGLGSAGSSVGNAASGFGDWLKNLFSGGGDAASGATSGLGAGGSVGGGMNLGDFFGGDINAPDNFDSSFGGVNYNPDFNYSGQWWSNDPVPGQDNTQGGGGPLGAEDAGIGQGMSSGFDYSQLINDAGNATQGSGMLEKIMKLLFGAGAGGAAAGAGGGSGGGAGGAGGLLGSLFGAGGGSNNGLMGLIGALMQGDTMGKLADKYIAAGDRAAALSDPFRDQRPQYQQMLAQSYNDPNFFQNNPTFRGITDLAGRQAAATAASQGYNMSGNAPIEVGKAINDAGLKYALPFQAQLGQNAGAGINPGYSGFLSQQGANMAAQAQRTQSGANFNAVTNGIGTLGQLGNMFV